jgi:hypothetical protein
MSTRTGAGPAQYAALEKPCFEKPPADGTGSRSSFVNGVFVSTSNARHKRCQLRCRQAGQRAREGNWADDKRMAVGG